MPAIIKLCDLWTLAIKDDKLKALIGGYPYRMTRQVVKARRLERFKNKKIIYFTSFFFDEQLLLSGLVYVVRGKLDKLNKDVSQVQNLYQNQIKFKRISKTCGALI